MLKRALHRAGATQKELRDVLEQEYGLKRSEKAINEMCQFEAPRRTKTWEIVQRCLKERYRIEFANGYWQNRL